MPLKLYNTLTRKKEIFKPLEKNKVKLYVCGPTVYDNAHLGHAKTYLNFDIMRRYLKYRGFDVLYVQNITDVGHLTDDADQGEDKILKRAQEKKMHPMQLAEYFTHKYFEDMTALKIQKADIYPRASGHILEQIELIKILLKKGYAYEKNGSVYFSVEKFKNYGQLTGRKIDEQTQVKKLELKEKKNPLDFALWKKAEKNHILQWPSPWETGFPGWHIECSAMSMKYLGETIDIHGGGVDNIFPHHENEIAQSEAATGKKFVRYWVHNGSLLINGKKMSKSLKNFITVSQALKKYSPEALRYFILSAHYRKPLDYNEKALQSAEKAINFLNQTQVALNKIKPSSDTTKQESAINQKVKIYKKEFLQAMDNDFNTAKASGVFFNFAHFINKYLSKEKLSLKSIKTIKNIFQTFGEDILGILAKPKTQSNLKCSKIIKNILELRNNLRKKQKWEMADKIREILEKSGVKIEDK